MTQVSKFFEAKFPYKGKQYRICSLDEKDYIFNLIAKSSSFYEEDILFFLERIPLKNGIIVDVGANLGNHTAFFAGALNRRTFAFEPSHRTFRALSETVRRNGFFDDEKVVLFNLALGEASKKGVLLMQEGNAGLGQIRNEEGAPVDDNGKHCEETIDIVPLDNVLGEVADIALIKIDVEGYEINVLKGAKETLERTRPLLTLECHSQDALYAIDKELWPLGYRPIGSAGRSFNCIYCHIADYEKVGQYAEIAHRWTVQKASEAASVRLAVSQEREKSVATLTELNQARKKLDALGAETAQTDAEHVKLKAAFDDLSQSLETAHEVAEQLKAERDQARTELKSASEALQSERGRLDTQFRKLEGERDGLMNRIRLLQAERGRLDTQFHKLEEERNGLMNRIRLLQAERGRLDTQFHKLEEERDGLMNRVRLLQAAYDERNAMWMKARAVAETMRQERNAAYAALAGKRNVLTRGLATLADNMARNDTARGVVLRTVPPRLRRAITSRLFPAPVVPRPPLPSVTRAKTAIPTGGPVSPTIPSPVVIRLGDGATYDTLVVCNAYPGGVRAYGGEFVKSRVDAYVRNGMKPLVLEASGVTNEAKEGKVDGVDCLRMPEKDFAYQLKFFKGRFGRLITHSPSPDVLQAAGDQIDETRCLHWFHGFEVRDYRRLYFNYTTEQMEALCERLDAVNARRFAAAGACFAQPGSKKIFVSDFIRSIAERDVGRTAENAHVIPNFIDGDFYAFKQKTPEMARRILLIRSFHARNYANDIAVEAIRRLASRPGFADLSFTIRGFGADFQPLTSTLAGLGNVDVKEGHLSPDEMRALHATHGIFLAPSRFDTQGVTMGEAMASGMVCVTNRVAAIPEYADDGCARLVRPDDPRAFAEAIWDLTQNPDQVSALSTAAASRVRAQCGLDQTIKRELALISA